MTRRAAPLLLGILAVAALIGLWLLAPDTSPADDRVAALTEPATPTASAPPVPAQAPPSAEVAAAADPDHLPDGTPITDACRGLITDHERNVPGWVLLDNLRARSARFEEPDIACITAAGLPPAVVRYAERHPMRR